MRTYKHAMQTCSYLHLLPIELLDKNLIHKSTACLESQKSQNFQRKKVGSPRTIGFAPLDLACIPDPTQ